MAKTGTLILRGTSGAAALPRPRFIALGSFDGLHIGHRALLSNVAESATAQSGIALVVSFYPHPAIVLGKTEERPPLLTLRQRLKILTELGFDALVMIRFTKALSQLSAEDFVSKILIEQLDVHTLFLGPDAAFGKGRSADAAKIGEILKSKGRGIVIVPHIQDKGVKIGSRLIRSQIFSGNVAEARRFLNAPFTIEGRVVRGEGRGKKISIPTANISTTQLLPALGVYAGMLEVGGVAHKAVVNIGKRPTFGGRTTTVEAHVLDYQGADFYRQRVSLSLIKGIRDEIRFADVNALVSQIHQDIKEARAALALDHG